MDGSETSCRGSAIVNPAALPWWGWVLLSGVLWLAYQFTDENSNWLIRTALVVGFFLSALIGIIRFVKWAWGAPVA
jgi:hypothetical protein